MARPNSNPQHPSNSGKVPTGQGTPSTYSPPPGAGAPPGAKTGSGSGTTKTPKSPPGSKLPQGAKAQARQAVRQQTRQALRSGMPVKASKKGLGITKNEGSPQVQKAIKTLGFKKAEMVVQATKKRRTTSTGSYKKSK